MNNGSEAIDDFVMSDFCLCSGGGDGIQGLEEVTCCKDCAVALG